MWFKKCQITVYPVHKKITRTSCGAIKRGLTFELI